MLLKAFIVIWVHLFLDLSGYKNFITLLALQNQRCWKLKHELWEDEVVVEKKRIQMAASHGFTILNLIWCRKRRADSEPLKRD